MSNDGIFEDRQNLIKIWENERRTRDLNATLIWENMKYFSGLFGGLLVAHTAFVTLISTNNNDVLTLQFRFSVLAFPIAIICMALCAEIDLRRRWSKFLLVVTQLLKLEELLGLQQDLSSRLNAWHTGKFLFDEYTKNYRKYKNSDEFKRPKIKTWSTYSLLSIIYFIMMSLGGYLLLVDVVNFRLQ